MTTFDRREAAIEAAFANHQGLLFQARVAGLREFASRAASELGKSPDESARYIDDLLATFIRDGQVSFIVAGVRADFERVGRMMNERSLMARYDEAIEKAASDILGVGSTAGGSFEPRGTNARSRTVI